MVNYVKVTNYRKTFQNKIFPELNSKQHTPSPTVWVLRNCGIAQNLSFAKAEKGNFAQNDFCEWLRKMFPKSTLPVWTIFPSGNFRNFPIDLTKRLALWLRCLAHPSQSAQSHCSLLRLRGQSNHLEVDTLENAFTKLTKI